VRQSPADRLARIAIAIAVAAVAIATPSPTPAADDAAAAYAALAEWANGEYDRLFAELERADGVEEARASIAAFPEVEERFIAELDRIVFPPEAQATVDELLDVERALLALERSMAEADERMFRRLLERDFPRLQRRASELAGELRARLGLPSPPPPG
jgi:predicted outer membrane protein